MNGVNTDNPLVEGKLRLSPPSFRRVLHRQSSRCFRSPLWSSASSVRPPGYPPGVTKAEEPPPITQKREKQWECISRTKEGRKVLCRGAILSMSQTKETPGKVRSGVFLLLEAGRKESSTSIGCLIHASPDEINILVRGKTTQDIR